jgi:transcriptional regulator with XRE-family HTH domain
LRAARQKSGLSQKSLGIAAGLDEFVASARVNQYERGVHAPDYGLVRRLARVLDVPVAYFYAEHYEEAKLLLLHHALTVAQRKRWLTALESARSPRRTGASAKTRAKP